MKFAVLDFETTGSQPGDEIIQVGLVTIQDDEIVETYASLIKPTIPVPAFITALTGIGETMLQDAPTAEEVLPEVVRRLEGSVLVAHNAGFDVAFLQRTLDYCGYSQFSGPVLDTMDFLRIAFPSLPSLQLGAVCQSLGIGHERPHQADSDALATAHIWLACLKRLRALPLLTLQRIVYLLSRDTTDTAAFFNELLLRKESEGAPEEDGQRYYRQFALNVDDWGDEQPLREEEDDAKERVGLPFDAFYAMFKENLRAKFAGYEDREAQEQMIREVALSFAEDRHLLIEAGTGTGKSLGYLLPALYHGINAGQKVVISTHTINLQEQLRQRDVPLLSELFPVPFRAAVLKGRSHYLCLRKFEHKIENEDFEYAAHDRQTAAQMLVWLGETKHGDDEELFFAGRGNEFWQTVSSDAESCLNRACPWFKKCFYHRAKHEANIADVVITNHSLLFTDIKADHRLLPGYKHLVVDEAHHFEDVASKHLGIELHYHAFAHALQALYRDARSGQLPALRTRFGQATGELAEQGAAWASLIDQQLEPLVAVKEMWDELVFLLYELVSSSQQDAEGGQYVLRIKDEQLPRRWTELCDMEDNLHIKLGGVLRKLEKALADWKDVQDDYDVQSLVTDVGGTFKELGRHRDALRFFMKRTDPSYVYWLEASAQFKAKSLLITCAPTDVSPMLRQYFFNEKKSIIMTSATLSVDRTFDYTRELLGLTDEKDETKLKAVILPSPFQYRKQALVVIPRDFPGIKGQSGDAYFVSCLIQSLKDVAIETKGRMLVLFTSYRMLKTVHPELRELLQPHGIEVLGQGIDSGNRSKLTKLFQESSASVLLGTSSFWEGVDIPGDALSVLAIVRLPFQPPNHPVAEAKSELIKKDNKNPFMKLSVPQAVIRFKQGFGRLVRTTRDKGIVIVYDTRVIDTQYGKHFLYSLPGPKIEHMRTNQLVPRISEWMGEAAKEEPC